MQSAPIVLDGKALSEKIKKELAERVLRLWGTPELIIFTNSDPASQVYVRNKVKFGEDIGVEVTLKNLYDELSVFRNSHGKYSRYDTEGTPFIIQLPIDDKVKHLFNLKKDEEIFQWFDGDVDRYDMDGFNPYNMGKLTLGLPCVAPCTPAGIIRLLEEHNITLVEKRVCILGRSNIVGKPLALMMMQRGATVTNIHTDSTFRAKYDAIHEADILISATGSREVVGEDITAYERIIVDVGMNRDENGKLCGDLRRDLVKEYAEAYTPVPGGVGPMTVAMLFNNVVNFYEQEERRWGIYR